MVSGLDPEELTSDQGAEIGDEDTAGEGWTLQGHRTREVSECWEQCQIIGRQVWKGWEGAIGEVRETDWGASLLTSLADVPRNLVFVLHPDGSHRSLLNRNVT